MSAPEHSTDASISPPYLRAVLRLTGRMAPADLYTSAGDNLMECGGSSERRVPHWIQTSQRVTAYPSGPGVEATTNV